jgi:hypothetical protein
MSFREKSAWVTFALLLVGFVIYFAAVFNFLHGTHASDGHGSGLFLLFLAIVTGFIVVEVVVHVVLAWRTPKEAKTPKDEREKLIEMKAMRPAFYMLLVGCFLTIGTLHLGTDAYHMAHSVLFVVWIAELVRYGMQLYYFRRGV